MPTKSAQQSATTPMTMAMMLPVAELLLVSSRLLDVESRTGVDGAAAAASGGGGDGEGGEEVAVTSGDGGGDGLGGDGVGGGGSIGAGAAGGRGGEVHVTSVQAPWTVSNVTTSTQLSVPWRACSTSRGAQPVLEHCITRAQLP